MKFIQAVMLVFIIVFIGSGLYVIGIGLGFTTQTTPTNKVQEINSYYFTENNLETVFSIKAQTIGDFIAGNPMNVSVTTNGLNVNGIQLEFLGASQYFPNNTRPVMPTLPPEPPSNMTQEQWWAQYDKDMQQYEKAMQQYNEEVQQQENEERTAIGSNILLLKNDTDIETYDSFSNLTIQHFPTFSGEMQNLKYPVGGEFSIGVTVTLSNGGVVGYGVGDTSYIINNYIEVAPSATLLQIQGNNILIGLTYVGIGVAPLIAGLLLSIEFLKTYAKEEKRDYE